MPTADAYRCPVAACCSLSSDAVEIKGGYRCFDGLSIMHAVMPIEAVQLIYLVNVCSLKEQKCTAPLRMTSTSIKQSVRARRRDQCTRIPCLCRAALTCCTSCRSPTMRRSLTYTTMYNWLRVYTHWSAAETLKPILIKRTLPQSRCAVEAVS